MGNGATVMALDAEGRLYSYHAPDGWQPLAGLFKDIGVGHDGAIWAIHADGHPCIYGSESSRWYELWYQLPSTLRHIAVGSRSNVWALDADSRTVDLTGGRMPFGESRASPPPMPVSVTGVGSPGSL